MEESLSETAPVIEMTGPDVEEAIQRGLAELGLARSDVKIDILTPGSKGLLGLNVRPARVRLTRLISESEAAPTQPTAPAPEGYSTGALASSAVAAAPIASASPELTNPDLQAARETLEELLDKMHMAAAVEAAWGEPDQPGEEKPILLDIRGDDLGSLIGRKGETLSALQFLTRLMVSNGVGRSVRVYIDVEGYKARRAQQLTKLALRMAEQVKRHGRPLPLEPMPASERRLIHLALRDDEQVYTESAGIGSQRKITIYPRVRRE